MEPSLRVAATALLDEMEASPPDLQCALVLSQSLIEAAIREELYEIHRFP